MALPWLRILDLVLTMLEFARKTSRRSLTAGLDDRGEDGPLAIVPRGRSSGAGVARLSDTFDREQLQRLKLEREQREAERRRADRLLKLELARQAGDREIGRLRMLAGTAIVSLLATLVIAGLGTVISTGARVALGVGWLCLLAAIATSFSGQAAVAAGLADAGERHGDPQPPSAGAGGAATLWLVLTGLVVMAVAVLLR
jgi:hypothetical protein